MTKVPCCIKYTTVCTSVVVLLSSVLGENLHDRIHLLLLPDGSFLVIENKEGETRDNITRTTWGWMDVRLWC